MDGLVVCLREKVHESRRSDGTGPKESVVDTQCETEAHRTAQGPFQPFNQTSFLLVGL
jgi:hypothetical protein